MWTKRAIGPDPCLEPSASRVFVVEDRVIEMAWRLGRSSLIVKTLPNLAPLCQRDNCPVTASLMMRQLASYPRQNRAARGATQVGPPHELLVCPPMLQKLAIR